MRLKFRRRRPIYYARFRAKKIRTGSCMECARRIVPGYRRCQIHIEKRRLRSVICIHCKRRIGSEFRTRVRLPRVHPACQGERRRLMQRLNWNRSKRPRSYVRSHREAVNRYQERHRKLGLCEICPRKSKERWRCSRHNKTIDRARSI